MENENIFILNNLDEINRLSYHSYNPEILSLINNIKNNKYGVRLDKLSEDITYSSGKWELRTTDYVPETFPNRIKLLQISNISENGEIIETERDKYIPLELHEKWKTSQVKKGDLVVAITGTLGRIALFNENHEANLNQALGVIRLKNEYEGIKIIPEYIHLYLNSYYAIEQFIRFGGFRAGQSGLSLDEIGSIYVILPKEDEQRRVINEINKIRNESIEHFNKYIEYSNKSKNVVIDILKITIPDENERIFIYSDNLKKRIDVPYNSPFLKNLLINIKNGKYSELNKQLKEADNKFIFSDFYNVIDLDNIDENISEIKDWEEVKSLNSDKTIFKKDNLLISKMGGEKGNIILINEKYDNFLGSGELVPFELREKNSVSLEYLFYILRSPYLSKQMEYSLSGCSRMRVSKEEMKILLIPLPKDEIQEKEIVNSCKELRKKAILEKEKYNLKKKEVYDKFKDMLIKYL